MISKNLGVSLSSRGRLTTGVAVLLLILLSGKTKDALAYDLILSDLSYGYSGCYYTDNGNGTSDVEVTISWKDIEGHTGNREFYGRGVLLHTYDANGKLTPSSAIASKVTLNGKKHISTFNGNGYTLYFGVGTESWKNPNPITATIVATLDNDKIKQWPAVGIRAGNYTSGNDVGESLGLAYIAPSNKNGTCHILTDPELPPPPIDVVIDMKAPDWDLGELKRGEETEKAMTDMNSQLCFTYNGGSYVIFQKYIISASNTNGESAAGEYLLRRASGGNSTIPYKLILEDGTSTVTLPNHNNTVFSLNKSGKTCFTPTFRTFAEKKTKGGVYHDILTFNIIAKP
ncbi:hypothetical protein [Pseudomonas hunanensis]|uniref:hypothetical protein n=1 Tax=Pseudomonas hunanensis TaxID=1247546 RepID=UPI002404AB31|nr:hypothetical protein [Pseudomonas hunanensis]MDF9755638.1 hypothetical protein [Pseudomonas hunanensis]